MSLSRKATSLIAAPRCWPSPDSSRTRAVAGGPQADRKGGHHGSKCQRSNNLGQEAARVRDAQGRHGAPAGAPEDRRPQRRQPGRRARRATTRPSTYVKKRMKRAGYRVTRPAVRRLRCSRRSESSELAADGARRRSTYVEDTDFAATPQSEPGDVTAAVTPVDLQLGLGNTSTSGCEAADFAGFPAGNIALHPARHLHVRDQGRERRRRRRGRRAVLQPGQHRRPGPAGHPRGHARQRLHRRHPGARARRTRSAPSWPASPDSTMRLFANVSRVKSVTNNVLAESRTR